MPQIEVLSEYNALYSHQDQWNAVAEQRHLGPAHRLDWLAAALDARGRGAEFFSLVVRHMGQPIGFAPFLAKPDIWHGLRTQTLIPLPLLNQLHGTQFVLAKESEAEACDAIVRWLAYGPRRWDSFNMIFLTGEPQAAAFRAALDRNRLAFDVASAGSSPYLALPSSWAELEKTLQSRFRSTLRSRERLLRSLGKVDVRFYTSPDDISTALDSIVQIENKSWKLHSGLPITAPVHWDFYHNFAVLGSQRGAVMLPVLYVNDEPVAFDYGVVDGTTYHLLQTSFRQDAEKIYPGTVLRRRVIDFLIEAGLTEIDFGGGESEWKRKWTRTSRNHEIYTVFQRSLIGQAMKGFRKIARWRGQRGQ